MPLSPELLASMQKTAGPFGSVIGMGADIGSYFDWRNPANAPMKYLEQGRNELPDYYKDYIQRGNRMGGQAEDQFGQLMNDPGGRMNQIGQSYQQSPGFQFQLQQALQAGNQSAAAGGMAGTPQHQQQNMGLANNLANQDYNQYMQNALGQYDIGLQGGQHMYDTGYGASNQLGQSMKDLLESQARLKYSGEDQRNKHQGSFWSKLGGYFSGGE